MLCKIARAFHNIWCATPLLCQSPFCDNELRISMSCNAIPTIIIIVNIIHKYPLIASNLESFLVTYTKTAKEGIQINLSCIESKLLRIPRKVVSFNNSFCALCLSMLQKYALPVLFCSRCRSQCACLLIVNLRKAANIVPVNIKIKPAALNCMAILYHQNWRSIPRFNVMLGNYIKIRTLFIYNDELERTSGEVAVSGIYDSRLGRYYVNSPVCTE